MPSVAWLVGWGGWVFSIHQPIAEGGEAVSVVGSLIDWPTWTAPSLGILPGCVRYPYFFWYAYPVPIMYLCMVSGPRFPVFFDSSTIGTFSPEVCEAVSRFGTGLSLRSIAFSASLGFDSFSPAKELDSYLKCSKGIQILWHQAHSQSMNKGLCRMY